MSAHAFSGCVNLVTITNYPDKKLEENVASNKRITHAWTTSVIQEAVKPSQKVYGHMRDVIAVSDDCSNNINDDDVGSQLL